MRYYIDDELYEFLQKDVEAVIELIKKAYKSTKEYYENKITDDFLYFNMYKTFTNGYCFYFARLLKSVYKDGKFVVSDKNYATFSHILLKINDDIYDIKGKRELKKYYILDNKIIHKIDENHNIINEEIYKTFKKYFYEYLEQYVLYNKCCIKKVFDFS
ncbi:MAG: hypothetical protein ACI4U0_01640 [Candidatus Aphodocola sp.]